MHPDNLVLIAPHVRLQPGRSRGLSSIIKASQARIFLQLIFTFIVYTAMASRSDSQPRGRRGGRNKSSQSRGQGRPMVSADEFTDIPVPSFQPIPYNGPPGEVSGAFPQSNPEHPPQPIPYSRIPPPLFPPENSTYGSSEAGPELAQEVYNNYSAGLPSRSSSDVVNERLRAASGMILTKGKDVDVLQKHQATRGSRAPSQERLRAFGDTLYSRAYASRQSSRSASLANSSFISLHSDKSGSQAFSNKNADLWRSYSPRDQEVLGQARVLMIYEMVTNIGWPVLSSGETARKRWKNTIREVVSQASAMIPGELLSSTKGIERLLMRALTLFRADLAGKAEPYAKLFFLNDDPALKADKTLFMQWKEDECARITNMSDPTQLFMHEHDEEGRIIRWFGNQYLENFQLNFWYTCELSPMKAEVAKDTHTTPLRMYALSAVALFYAIKRESKRNDETLPHMPFTGTEFSPVFEALYDSLLVATQHSAIGARLNQRLEWLHRSGLEKMKPIQISPPSPHKQRNVVFIPPADEITAYESYPGVNSHPFDMPVNRSTTDATGVPGGSTSVLRMEATPETNFSAHERYLANTRPADMPVGHGTTSTTGVSGSITCVPGMEATRANSSGNWSMEFQGLGPSYYQYDL